MGRLIPLECDHGVVLDWGDFGPDPDNPQAGIEPCPDCARRVREQSDRRAIAWIMTLVSVLFGGLFLAIIWSLR